MKAKTINKRVFGPLAIGWALLLCSGSLLAVSEDASVGGYTAQDQEYYLTAEQLFFIRPGLDIEVLDVEIPSDMSPLVTFSVKDPGGLPLDLDGVFTPGAVDMRFMLTYIPQGEEQKVRLTEGTRDQDGTFQALGDGQYTYKFATILPDTYDPDATHTLGVVGRRDLTEFDLDRYVDNVVYNFVPSGASEPMPRDVVTTETCNGRCHDPLAMHGGRYREVGICTQCHNPQLFDEEEGLSYSFDVLIHRVHHELGSGYPAPLNDCQTCHTGGTPTEAFPLVASPNPAPVCDYSGYGMTELTWGDLADFDIHVGSPDGSVFASGGPAGSQETGKWVSDGTEFYLVDKATGDTVQQLKVNTSVFGCAGVAPGTFRGVPGEQHTNWMDHPSRLVCGSCHENVNFETGEGHAAGAQADDSRCGNCHRPYTGNEFDRSVAGAHTVLYKSAQLPGLLVNILDITNTGPGQRPEVHFTVGSKNGPINPIMLDRLRFTITGPNSDFQYYVQETVGSAAVLNGDEWVYTFKKPLPKTASGSYTVGFEGRNEVEVDIGEDEPSAEEDQAQDYTVAFAVTDEEVNPRRMVVADYNCESCHTNLSLHGGNRNNPQYCVTCHRPDANDEEVRPPLAGEPQSIDFKFLIHRLHRGADLENDFIVYGFRSSVHDFGEVEFPGDLRNCDKCHVDDSYQLPLQSGLLATDMPRALWTPWQPTTTACLACHDSEDAAAHAYSNTTFFGEACATCHGEGMEFAVDKVHAR